MDQKRENTRIYLSAPSQHYIHIIQSCISQSGKSGWPSMGLEDLRQHLGMDCEILTQKWDRENVSIKK